MFQLQKIICGMFNMSEKKDKKRNYLRILFCGLCMGCADVVPGVSGGTMAFILGIYEELINSIRTFGSKQFLGSLLRFKFKDAFLQINYKFLISLGSGIVIAILSLAKIISWTLDKHAVLIWSFFFGLVLASIFTVSKRISAWNFRIFLSLAAGAILSYIIVGAVPLQTPETFIFLFTSGMLSICAMILPGISGAYILVLFGKYHFILQAVNQRDIYPIMVVGLGAIIGLVSFTQVLGWLFKKYHDVTVAVLIGVMFGSLRKIWPWKLDICWLLDGEKNFVMKHGKRIVTEQNNIIPEFMKNGSINIEIIYAATLLLVGIAVVIWLESWASKGEEPSENMKSKKE